METYALTNCILLDGTQTMQPQKGMAVLGYEETSLYSNSLLTVDRMLSILYN